MGIAVNLVTYLTGTMHLGNASAANTVTNFLGTSFMLCLFGGFVADTFIGRFVFLTNITCPLLLKQSQDSIMYFIQIEFVTVLFPILYTYPD